jgi:hypothetical protein
MPTIPQLTPAIAAADTDELPASQGGVLRSVTRAQLLAGTQPAITLPTGTILGRVSPTAGGPETINIGQGLTLTAAGLAAVPPATPSLAGLDASAALVTPAGAATAPTPSAQNPSAPSVTV